MKIITFGFQTVLNVLFLRTTFLQAVSINESSFDPAASKFEGLIVLFIKNNPSVERADKISLSKILNVLF
ncbi:hypothetical protein D3C86_1984290 [compost metagenome]